MTNPELLELAEWVEGRHATIDKVRRKLIASHLRHAATLTAELASLWRERDGLRASLSGCRAVLDGLRTVSGTTGEKKYDCAESRGGSLVNVAHVIEHIDAILDTARGAGNG